MSLYCHVCEMEFDEDELVTKTEQYLAASNIVDEKTVIHGRCGLDDWEEQPE